MSFFSSKPKNQDVDRIWEQVKGDLRNVPLRESACKAKIIADLKAKMSPQNAAASLVKDINARPSHYLDIPDVGPQCFTPSCFSRGRVCLSMLSR
jgi:hypothetical protein